MALPTCASMSGITVASLCRHRGDLAAPDAVIEAVAACARGAPTAATLRMTHHDVWQVGGVRSEVSAQPVEFGKSAGVKVGRELIGELGLAAALMSEREEIDHDPAGLLVR